MFIRTINKLINLDRIDYIKAVCSGKFSGEPSLVIIVAEKEIEIPLKDYPTAAKALDSIQNAILDDITEIFDLRPDQKLINPDLKVM